MEESQPFVTLNNGLKMPQFGLGTFQSSTGEVKAAVLEALKLGYLHIDTAFAYKNEKEIGEALKEFLGAEGQTKKREDLFITTKLLQDNKASVEEQIQTSLDNLGLDYLDLYLVHWPTTAYNADTESWERQPMHVVWKKMEDAVKAGKIKSIGISNYNCQAILDLLTYCEIKPAVNQIEMHPYLPQENLVKFMHRVKIYPEAYSPLGAPGTIGVPRAEDKVLLKDALVLDLAKKYDKTPGQILINWALQRNTIVIPKSVTPSRIKENMEALNFKLEKEDVEKLTGLNCNFRAFNPLYFKGFGYLPVFD